MREPTKGHVLSGRVAPEAIGFDLEGVSVQIGIEYIPQFRYFILQILYVRFGVPNEWEYGVISGWISSFETTEAAS